MCKIFRVFVRERGQVKHVRDIVASSVRAAAELQVAYLGLEKTRASVEDYCVPKSLHGYMLHVVTDWGKVYEIEFVRNDWQPLE